MPKFKGRTSDKGKWGENKMKKAIKCVIEGKLSVRQAEDIYDVPKSSLHDRLKVLKSGKEIDMHPKLGRFQATMVVRCTKRIQMHRDLSFQP
jgi:helix-turn-helix, Psq domain